MSFPFIAGPFPSLSIVNLPFLPSAVLATTVNGSPVMLHDNKTDFRAADIRGLSHDDFGKYVLIQPPKHILQFLIRTTSMILMRGHNKYVKYGVKTYNLQVKKNVMNTQQNHLTLMRGHNMFSQRMNRNYSSRLLFLTRYCSCSYIHWKKSFI